MCVNPRLEDLLCEMRWARFVLLMWSLIFILDTQGPRRAMTSSILLIMNYNIELSNLGAVLCHSRSINSAWAWLRTVTRHGNGSMLDGKKKFVLSSTSSFPSYRQQQQM
jgi:hypothetical protein